MKASLPLCFLVYAPHLLEEHWSRMHDDPLIVAAFSPLSTLSSRAASYFVFQATMLAALAAVALASQGERARRLVLGALALGMLAEVHHLVRALATLKVNSGLYTALPVAAVGALLLHDVFSLQETRSCST